jgi:hypothetical protein
VRRYDAEAIRATCSSEVDRCIGAYEVCVGEFYAVDGGSADAAACFALYADRTERIGCNCAERFSFRDSGTLSRIKAGGVFFFYKSRCSASKRRDVV